MGVAIDEKLTYRILKRLKEKSVGDPWPMAWNEFGESFKDVSVTRLYNHVIHACDEGFITATAILHKIPYGKSFVESQIEELTPDGKRYIWNYRLRWRKPLWAVFKAAAWVFCCNYRSSWPKVLWNLYRTYRKFSAIQ